MKTIQENKNINTISTSNSDLWCYFEGEFLPSSEAHIGLSNQAFNYGTGAFEGIRAYKSENTDLLNIFRLQDHYRRFLESSSYLNIALNLDLQELAQITIELLKINDFQSDCYIRPIGFKKTLLPGAKFGVRLSGVSSGFAIKALPMGSYINPSGIHCGVSSWRRISDAAMPSRAKITGGYVNSALAMESAQASGFDDALIFNDSGNLAEATTSNVFLIYKDRLVTPPKTSNILPGITRDSVFKIAKQELNLEVVEQNLSLSDVMIADECFITGTGVEVTSVISVNRKPIGEGEIGLVTSKIQAIYRRIVRGQQAHYHHWLTPVV